MEPRSSAACSDASATTRPSSIWCASPTVTVSLECTQGCAGETRALHGGESAEPLRPSCLGGGLHAARRRLCRLDHLSDGAALPAYLRAARRHIHLPLPAAARGVGRCGLRPRVHERPPPGVLAVVTVYLHARLRRGACLQPAGSVFSARGILQAARKEIRVRSSRPRA